MTEAPEPGTQPQPLEATGERLVPEAQRGELVHAEHLARYRLAARLAPGRRVLDAACGEGYGTAMLAAAGAVRAVGVDVDEATITHAAQRYGPEFARANVEALPFEDGAFDLAVSFETIEHVGDAAATLRELRRVLAPGGLLVVSTPNKHEYLVENEFHTREFTHEQFVGLLNEHFPSVRLLYQQNWLASAILEEAALREQADDRALDAELFKVVGAEPGRELYTIGICGDETDVEIGQVVVAAGIDEAHQLARRTVDAERMALVWQGKWEASSETIRRMRASLGWRLTSPLRLRSWLRHRRGG